MYHPEVVERLVSLATAHPELYRKNMDAEQTRMYALSLSRSPNPRVCMLAGDGTASCTSALHASM